jgi:hypothetical protein
MTYRSFASKKRTTAALNCSWNAARSKPGSLLQTSGIFRDSRALQGGRKS